MSRLSFPLLLIAMLGGCAASVPEAALRLPESTLEVRSIQTRTLAAPSEIDILTATIAVLQDMEFNIERIEKPLGVITASKVTDADSRSEKTGLLFLDVLCAAGRRRWLRCHVDGAGRSAHHVDHGRAAEPGAQR